MAAAVANGTGSPEQSRTQNRSERRKEWWSNNKEFKSKLRDRSTLSKKENEQQQMKAAIVKVDTSRGFRSSTIISRMSSATPSSRVSAAPASRVSSATPASRVSSTAPANRMSLASCGVTTKKSFLDTKKQLALSSKQKAKSRTKGAPKVQNSVAKKKAKSTPARVSPGKPKVLDKVAVIETILAKPEMAEISLNARGVELANMANHINPRYVLFIGNLPYTIDKGQLMSHFRKAGGVKSVRIPKNKEGLGKGFAYIEFKDRISHGIALRLHHTTLAGRRINVEFVRDDKKKNQENSS